MPRAPDAGGRCERRRHQRPQRRGGVALARGRGGSAPAPGRPVAAGRALGRAGRQRAAPVRAPGRARREGQTRGPGPAVSQAAGRGEERSSCKYLHSSRFLWEPDTHYLWVNYLFSVLRG